VRALERSVGTNPKSQKFSIITQLCYVRDILSFIHLCDAWSCTQEIWVKAHMFKSGFYEKNLGTLWKKFGKGNFEIVLFSVNYSVERWCKENGCCTQLEKNGYFAFFASFFPDINGALSIDGFSDWSNANTRLAEHEKFSCHLQASVQWFDAEQKVTRSCSLDSIHQQVSM